MPGGPLEHASAEYNSIYGKISSGWRKVNNGLELDVTIPPNTTAKVVLPVEEGLSLLLDGDAIANNPKVKIINKTSDNIAMEIVPGAYSFRTKKH
jgi:alpha-L-rhamnosidase